MVIKRLEDIEREKSEEKREKFKKQITEDTKDVLERVFGKQRKEKTIGDVFWNIIKWILILVLIVTIINFIFGNIWLLKFFVKEFF